MTNILDGLLGRIQDSALREALQIEVNRLRSTKDFGLVFEKHLPENVRLYSHPVRRGLRVEERATKGQTTWLVRRVRDGQATIIDSDGLETTRSVEDLVVVRQFGEPIYPGFRSVDRIERGGDKPFHTIINGENFHVLETALFAYEGQVDCIYIDPPYNTGAKDWKYNNDYVAADDAYRHSKWLSFIERRLQVAKRLLNPDESVLIVTIDEKEYLRLGMLLEQIFPECLIQMATSVISAKGTSRARELSRVSEHIFIVMVGTASVGRAPTNMLDGGGAEVAGESVEWLQLRRREPSSVRSARPNQFYPIFVNEADGSLHSIGDPLPQEVDRFSIKSPKGTRAFFPLNSKGKEMLWGLTPEALRQRAADGYFRVRNWNEKKGTASFQYLQSGTIQGIVEGRIQVTGRDPDGAVQAVVADSKGAIPKTVWNLESHNAETQGTNIITKLVPGRRFDYPKSLYAVEDVLRLFVKDKSDALILDFFGGSGTTAQAVMRLNRQDGGRRRSIVVTNNEVSENEAASLRLAGHSPGDEEWEALGIFRYITWPRVRAAVTGKTPEGSPVVGEYKFTDQFPMADGFEENVEFLELSYLDRNDVSRGKAFEAIAPLLWLKIGARGELISKQKSTFDIPEGAFYAVLFDIEVWPDFVQAIRKRNDLVHVFIVTDSLAMYQQVVAELPAELEATMLYEDYLRNFEINMRGML